IPSGTTAPLNGAFRVVDLAAPLVLQPGQYQIGGLDTLGTPDPITYMWDGGIGVFNTPSTYVGSFFYADMTGSGYPASSPDFGWVNSNNFYLASGLELGPMLFVVPEFSVAGLMLPSGLLLLRRRRRRRL
ncbi:MAG: hypothetical protein KDN05_03610, partial [Verrucomicrobiae bacterium]|nr:hypothetical protein [Verrucomicrobiae bacterium]